jgi:regulatory protein
MKITRIAQQAKQAGRYSVFVDGRYGFSLSETALLASGLASGQELNAEQLAAYKQKSAEDKLYNRTLRYVVLRPRTVWEVEQYLQRKGSPAPLIEQITNKLSKVGLLSDEAFAKSYLHDRQLLRPASRRKITLELRKKHVSDEVITEVVGAETGNDETALARIIATKRRQAKYQDDLRLMQYLARQGFSYGAIKDALQAERDS